MEHPTQTDLDLFVMNALDADRRASVAAHVRACPTCSDALIESARVEELAWQLAGSKAPGASMRGWVVVVIAVGAVAAAVLLVISTRQTEQRALPALAQPGRVVCIDSACIDAAFRAGLAPQAPTLVVPRYETMFRSIP